MFQIVYNQSHVPLLVLAKKYLSSLRPKPVYKIKKRLTDWLAGWHGCHDSSEAAIFLGT